MNSLTLAEQLLANTLQQVQLAEASYLPRFELPCHFAGHQVGADTRADVAFTLGLLRENGIEEVAGVSLVEALRRVLFSIDGEATHTFFSYRVAETLARFGPIGKNRLLEDASDQQIANLIQACDSSASADQLRSGRLPRNYAPVLARCEVARQCLGIPHDPSLLAEMLERTRQMFDQNPGFLDDSSGGTGRYDLYAADAYLFCEPIAEMIGPSWERGVRAMLDWVRKVASEDGCAMAWGRSTGALGICHTVELGAMALARELTDVPAVWLALAANAQGRLKDWFAGGVTTAHQYRSSDPYRGPRRRLQLTFDILGKLAEAARQLRSAPPVEAASLRDAFPERDELIWLDQDKNACVWTYRSSQLAFTLPVTGCTLSDYLPAPRRPGVFEGQVGSDQAVAVPFLVTSAGRHVGAGLPAAVAKSPGTLELKFDGWPLAGDFEGERAKILAFPGARVVRYHVEGSTFHGDEALQFAEPPLFVGMQIAEAQGRPLRVVYDGPSSSVTTVVDTAGMSEWRSFWGELPRVHQLALPGTSSIAFSWSMTSMVKVVTYAGASQHHYLRTIYDTLREEVLEYGLPAALPPTDAALRALVSRADVFHQHWPEWVPLDLEAHKRLISALEAAEVPVVWTMHNLQPHDRDPAGDDVYAAWAKAAAVVTHHSHWGLQQAQRRFRFRPDAVHVVVPHPHFSGASIRECTDRAEVERELGLRPGAIRLGIIGAPRREKQTGMVVEALRACPRSDLELLILSLGPEEPVSPHARVRALPYSFVPRAEYDRRLAAIDAVVLPFAETGMLTTGTVGDVLGHGIPALVSDWPFLTEVLGGAAIRFGNTVEQLTDCLRTLTAERLAEAAAASRALRPAFDPARIGQQLCGLLRSVARCGPTVASRRS